MTNCLRCRNLTMCSQQGICRSCHDRLLAQSDDYEDRMIAWTAALLNGLVTIQHDSEGRRVSSRLTHLGVVRARVQATSLGIDADSLTPDQTIELAVYGELQTAEKA